MKLKNFLKKYFFHIIFGVLFIAAFLPYVSDGMSDFLRNFLVEKSQAGILVFMSIMIVSVVIAPITTFPLIPVFADYYSPLEAAIYTILGWFIGAMIAYALAQYLSRGALHKLVSESALNKYLHHLPKKQEFWSLVVMRIFIPVDILSYILGIFTEIPWKMYALSTFIGIIPFAFIDAYGGLALIDAEIVKALEIGLLAALILFGAFMIHKKIFKNKNREI